MQFVQAVADTHNQHVEEVIDQLPVPTRVPVGRHRRTTTGDYEMLLEHMLDQLIL
jgi:hypothetical protein